MLTPIYPTRPPRRLIPIGEPLYPDGNLPVHAGALQPLLPLTDALANVSRSADQGTQQLAAQVKETGIGVGAALLGLAAAILIGAYMVRSAPPQIVVIERH